jgi:hypothetical protein
VVYLHGDYYLTDHDDVLAALRDPALVCPHMDPHMYPWVPSTVSDPAEHARYRSILNPRFTPLALAPVTAAVQDHAVALVDWILACGAGQQPAMAVPAAQPPRPDLRICRRGEFLQRIPEFRTADGYSVLAAEVDRYLTHLPLVW